MRFVVVESGIVRHVVNASEELSILFVVHDDENALVDEDTLMDGVLADHGVLNLRTGTLRNVSHFTPSTLGWRKRRCPCHEKRGTCNLQSRQQMSKSYRVIVLVVLFL